MINPKGETVALRKVRYIANKVGESNMVKRINPEINTVDSKKKYN